MKTVAKTDQIIVSSSALLHLVEKSEEFRKEFSMNLMKIKSRYDMSLNKIVELEKSKTLLSI